MLLKIIKENYLNVQQKKNNLLILLIIKIELLVELGKACVGINKLY
jgi:hypothetical protein